MVIKYDKKKMILIFKNFGIENLLGFFFFFLIEKSISDDNRWEMNFTENSLL